MKQDAFNYAVLEDVIDRPWPLPAAPWVMRQTWHDLLFAHWPVDPLLLASKLPTALKLDLFNGDGWIGIVPFHMSNVAPRAVPALPWVSAFPELNVRTYVTSRGKPGVYFFSLDAGSSLAVRVARAVFNLPYFLAAMSVEQRDGSLHYRSERKHRGGTTARLVADYAPAGPPFRAREGTLEYFLTERYCLYTTDKQGVVRRLNIHHAPWPLQVADAVFHSNTMADAVGVQLPAVAPRLHFAKRQDMVAWLPERVT